MNASDTLTAKLGEALAEINRDSPTTGMVNALMALTEAAQNGTTLAEEHHAALFAILNTLADGWLNMIFGTNAGDQLIGVMLLEKLRPAQPTTPDFDAMAGSVTEHIRPLLEAKVTEITESYAAGKMDHDIASQALCDLGVNQDTAIELLNACHRHRTIVRVIATDETEMIALIPDWSVSESVTIPRKQFDETVLPWIAVAPETQFFAYVNIGERDKTKLRFSRWKIVPEPSF